MAIPGCRNTNLHVSQSENRILKRMIAALVLDAAELRHFKLQKAGRWSREEATRHLQSDHEIQSSHMLSPKC